MKTHLQANAARRILGADLDNGRLFGIDSPTELEQGSLRVFSTNRFRFPTRQISLCYRLITPEIAPVSDSTGRSRHKYHRRVVPMHWINSIQFNIAMAHRRAVYFGTVAQVDDGEHLSKKPASPSPAVDPTTVYERNFLY